MSRRYRGARWIWLALFVTVIAFQSSGCNRQPSPTETPAPSVSPSGAVTPTPPPIVYKYVFTPPPGASPATSDAPVILEIDVNDQTLHAPGPLNVRVLTNSSVVNITVHSFGREGTIPQTGPGLFSLNASIPRVPFFMIGRTFGIDVIAANQAGVTTTAHIALKLAK